MDMGLNIGQSFYLVTQRTLITMHMHTMDQVSKVSVTLKT